MSNYSTVLVKYNTYSVPSRLKRERIRVRVYERILEVWHAGKRQFATERLKGRFRHRINYRHIIWSLVRKPGAFARYRYRENLYPSPCFRQAYDLLYERRPNVHGDLDYLRLLHLAAATAESEVQAAIECLLESGQLPAPAAVRDLVMVKEAGEPMVLLERYEVSLGDYDDLLEPARTKCEQEAS